VCRRSKAVGKLSSTTAALRCSVGPNSSSSEACARARLARAHAAPGRLLESPQVLPRAAARRPQLRLRQAGTCLQPAVAAGESIFIIAQTRRRRRLLNVPAGAACTAGRPRRARALSAAPNLRIASVAEPPLAAAPALGLRVPAPAAAAPARIAGARLSPVSQDAYEPARSLNDQERGRRMSVLSLNTVNSMVPSTHHTPPHHRPL